MENKEYQQISKEHGIIRMCLQNREYTFLDYDLYYEVIVIDDYQDGLTMAKALSTRNKQITVVTYESLDNIEPQLMEKANKIIAVSETFQDGETS